MGLAIINSKENKLIKLTKKLFDDKKNRDASNLFVVESYRIVKDLIAHGNIPQNILVSSNSKYISEFKDATIVENKIFSTISLLGNSDGVLAIFPKKNNSFEILPNKKYVLLDNIQNPSNVGSIIRTCVAFDIDGILLVNGVSDITNPMLIRSSMGSNFFIPINVYTSFSDVVKVLKKNKITIYATALDKNAKKINDIIFDKSSCLVFGNEGNGLSKQDIELCNQTIYVPISDKIDSLSVSNAAAIIIYLFK
jgi:TrmH family RNA methyltransferase